MQVIKILVSSLTSCLDMHIGELNKGSSAPVPSGVHIFVQFWYRAQISTLAMIKFCENNKCALTFVTIVKKYGTFRSPQMLQ